MRSSAIYDSIGIGYSGFRRPDPRIAARVNMALGSAGSILNVGAGAGSYEPIDRDLVAVEPSATMVSQRPVSAARVVRGAAECLPFRGRSFDAAMAVLTIHHWSNWRQGLLEMRRVARSRIVLLTWDPGSPGFWLTEDYFPEILPFDRRIFPTIGEIGQLLGPIEVEAIPIPHDCLDGFLGAYWRRPERYLDPASRQAISAFARFSDSGDIIARLKADLESGAWDARNRAIVDLSELDLGYRLIVAAGVSDA